MNVPSIIINCLVFGFIGYLLSKKYRKKINYTTLILFIVLSLALFFVGVGTRVFSFFSFSIMLNQVLGSLFGGFAIGLFVKIEKSNDSKLLIVTIFLAIFNGVLAWTSYRLATVAADTLAQTKETSKVELKAFLQVVDAKLTQMAPGKTEEVIVYYKNTGITPAYDIQYQVDIMPGGKGVSDKNWEDLKNSEKKGWNVLGANSIYHILIPSDIMIKDSTTIPAYNITGSSGPGKFLAVYGYIYYNDIYGDSHWTQFYFQWWRDHFLFAPEKNDADKY
jgi:hypothetical protein